MTIQALISSPAGLDTLAQHLGDALVVQEPGGQTLLQRSYAPHVLLLTEVPLGRDWGNAQVSISIYALNTLLI
ncbi:hypothetical protein SF06_28210 [Pseudomonas flexibilis]|nr:hypothetical protein SF06_28210 [Pseudomonas flexibilis]